MTPLDFLTEHSFGLIMAGLILLAGAGLYAFSRSRYQMNGGALLVLCLFVQCLIFATAVASRFF